VSDYNIIFKRLKSAKQTDIWFVFVDSVFHTVHFSDSWPWYSSTVWPDCVDMSLRATHSLTVVMWMC